MTKEITVKKALSIFEDECLPYNQYSRKTILRYNGIISKYKKQFPKLLLKDLTETEIKKNFYNQSVNNSCRADISYINRIGNWILYNYPKSTTFKPIKQRKQVRSPKNPLSEETITHIYRHPEICPVTKDIIQLYILTGCRVSELCRPDFTWEQIDEENEVAFIKNKGHKKSTDIPLKIPFLKNTHIALIKRINQYYQEVHDDANVYPIPASQVSIRNRIKVVSKLCGVDFTVHDLRDTSATMMLRETENIYAVKEHLGHSNVAVTEACYADWNMKDKTKAVHTLQRKMISLVAQ